MKKSLSLTELRAALTNIDKRLEKEPEILLTRRGKTIAVIRPAKHAGAKDSDAG